MKFRSDINGLRAIAVLAVVLYHFNVNFFNGGFVGVDVFFVISGFLMTSIIIGRTENKSFSLIGFYFDRARRIIPALGVLCLSLAVLCWFILLPVDYATLGKHIYSSIAFFSNIVYFNEINYFDASSDQKWLLHTWSLSVEWQFYIIYPILIMAAFKTGGIKSVKALLFVGFSLSLISSIYLSYSGMQSKAFYLLHTRAWEMIAGGAIYFLPEIKNKRTQSAMYYAGLIGITVSILCFTKYTVWPGYLAIIPVLSAVLILAAKKNSPLLDNALFQFIGKISYSVYLWHWPVVVLSSYLSYTSNLDIAIAIAVSLFLGTLSFYVIENPSRKSLNKFSGKTGIEFLTVITIVSIPYISGFSIYHSDGAPSRYPFSLLTQEQIDQERARYWGEGDKENPIPKNGEKKFVIIGNSHGIDLTYALIENGIKGDITYLRTTNFCSNFGYTPNIPEYKKTCSEIYNNVINNNYIKDADYILLHDDWEVVNLEDLRLMIAKIRTLTRAKIYVFGPKMMFKASPSEISAKAMSEKNFTIEMINEYAKRYYNENRFSIDKSVKNTIEKIQSSDNGVEYIDTLELQCGKIKLCEIIGSGNKKYFYFDSGHFTAAGSKNFGEALKLSNPELFPDS
ncbi:acyltransferase family protein [Enterobacter asburiae]|uniref:acyltransferase family protein n=1 Tax=Enterobacter asburiae TaxID=61645 RepID=UPI0022985F64|nr:acyltransferase [Enterobacter asburiae]HCU0704169.1 acyltransferase [Enterobacter asburiae]